MRVEDEWAAKLGDIIYRFGEKGYVAEERTLGGQLAYALVGRLGKERTAEFLRGMQEVAQR